MTGSFRCATDRYDVETFYDQRPHRLAGLALLTVLAAVVTLTFLQFRGALSPNTTLTVMAGRSGLVLDRGAKVTYNGVVIGRVSDITAVRQGEKTRARLAAEVASRYLSVMPANVRADVRASTIFGNKVLELSAPPLPVSRRVSATDVIEASTVTTEFQTLFETVTAIAQKVDPVKLNLTLSALAESLTGLGERLGTSLAQGAVILDQVNPRLPAINATVRGLADVADIYTAAGPHLWDGIDNSLTTTRTLNTQQSEIDAALLAATGFGNGAAETLSRTAPFLIRLAADLVPTSRLLNYYSPEVFCTIRNVAEVVPAALSAFGGNGYSLSTHSSLIGAPNPYVYPDNLPRINARGGPGGSPGCWQRVDRNFWPAPTLVADTGASLAPYNHIEFGQPFASEFIWGRQIGENTINP